MAKKVIDARTILVKLDELDKKFDNSFVLAASRGGLPVPELAKEIVQFWANNLQMTTQMFFAEHNIPLRTVDETTQLFSDLYNKGKEPNFKVINKLRKKINDLRELLNPYI